MKPEPFFLIVSDIEEEELRNLNQHEERGTKRGMTAMTNGAVSDSFT